MAAVPGRDPVSDSVGATVAQFRVDEGGNATYAVPIQLPPGTAGLAPKLALTYSSRGGNGPMGPGWTIEGASQISRCRQARENGDFMSGLTPVDGNPLPINFTSSDRFCLDGVRLLVTSGGYGSNGSAYSPENDPTTQVTAVVTNAAAGPDSFVVKRKDGTTSAYGNTTISAASRVSASVNGITANLSWSLSRTQDTVGNYIDYLYQNQPAGSTYPFAPGAVETVLKQVNYTGHLANPVVAPYVSVVFNYTTLPLANVRLGYQAGVAFLQSQQLTSISVEQPEFPSPDSTARFYSFSYSTSLSGSSAQQLNQIRECRDSTLAVCFPPTTFEWSSANYAFVEDSPQSQSGPDFTSLVGYKVGDVDGDGRQDIVWAKNGDLGCAVGTTRLYVSFLDRTASNQMTLVTPAQVAICSTTNLQGKDSAWQLLDYDGDGRADLLIGGGAKIGNTVVGSSTTWSAFASSGRPNSGAAVFASTDLFASLATPITIPSGLAPASVLADVNGDGLPDFLYPANAQTDSYTSMSVRLLQRTGSGALAFSNAYRIVLNIPSSDTFCTVPSGVMCTFNFFVNDPQHRYVIASDINGDGRADLTFLIHQISGGCPTCRPGEPVYDPDLGLSGVDAPEAGNGTRWYQFTVGAISAGASPTITLNAYWHQVASPAAGTMPPTSDKVYIVDLNGDGLADILYQDPVTATTYTALINTGSGYQSPITITNVTANNVSPSIQFADVTGDGRLDIVYYTSNTSASYVSLRPGTASNWTFTAPTPVPGSGVHAGANWIALLGDFDGDGAADFLALQVQATSGNLYTSRAAASSRYHPRGVITGFTNGLGAKTSVVYQPLTNKGVYQPGIDGEMPSVRNHVFGWGSPVFDILAPIYVVSQASSSAPVRGNPAALSTIYYRYQAALMQSGGRGFLGFWQTHAFDGNDQAATGQYIVTVNGYGQSYPFIGMPLTNFVLKFNGTLTRGTPELDACAANPETPSYNCFAFVGGGQPRWPILIDSGVRVRYTGQQPYCNGAGCRSLNSDQLSQCSTFSLREAPPVIESYYLDGQFVPASTASPVFSYIYSSNTAQYDPDASGPGTTGQVTTAGSFSYTCYEDGWANVTHARTVDREGDGTLAAQKVVANTYTNDTTQWLLGRLTNSVVKFGRLSTPDIARTSDFTYDTTTGLLTSERVQKNLGADQDLRTLYTLDAFGNRTEAWQCSADLSDLQCTDLASTLQRPVDATGHSGRLVHRYAKTLYGTRGRYSIGSKMPFYSPSAPNRLNEQTAFSVTARDEFGNATQQSSINGSSQTSLFGALGRPYYAADNLGHASTTTYRLCSAVSCPSDAKFRSQTTTAGAPSTWTYYDLLGRPILKIGQSFDSNGANQQFSGTCSYYDAHGRAGYVTEPFFVPAQATADGSPALTSTQPCSGVYAPYTTTTSYDGLGRVKQIARPDGGIVRMSYVGLHTFTTDPRGNTWEEVKNALGETIEKRDPDDPNDPADNLIVRHTYDAAGNLLTITRDAGSGTITSSATYDALGRKLTLTDPDSGYNTFSYNAAGEVVSQTDAKNQTIQNDYDVLGRVWRRTAQGADGNTITDSWIFDTATNGLGQIANEARSATTGPTYSRATTYDSYGRLSQKTTSIAGNSYLEATAYDGFGRPRTQRDAAGYTTTTNYTAGGYMQSLYDSHVGGAIYEALAMTARGQIQQDRRGANANLLGTMTYAPATGRLSTVCAGVGCALQDLSFNFDLVGNLTQRARGISTTQSTIEQVGYDAVNRMTSTSLTKIQGVVQNPPVAGPIVYDKLGNICNNAGIAYTYAGPAGCANHGSSGSPHAVTSRVGGGTYIYDANGNLTGGTSGRTFAWNALNQVTSITKGAVTTTFDYAPDGSRFRRTDSDANATVYIVGNVEFVIVAGTPSANVTRRYLGGVAIDFLYGSGSTETRYVFNDHLGSLSVYANSTGGLIAEQSFRALGTRRDPLTWQGTATQPPGTPRGFTGHEHVNAQSVIHMNGRIYDPQMGRMLQPDPLLDGSNQGLNRYSYVVNNPLTLTDPSGYSWFGDMLRAVVGIAIAIWAPEFLEPYLGTVGGVIAAGFAAGVVTSGNLQGGIYGAFSAGLFFGIGTGLESAGWATQGEHVFGTGFNAIGFTSKVIAHGLAGGVMSSLQGGQFGNGFLSAGVTQAFSGGIDRLDVGNVGVSAQRVMAAAILGGTTSVIAGGKFANGAVTGAFSRAFNDEATDQKMRKAASAMAEADDALRTAGVLGKGYSSEDALAIDWDKAVHPVSEKYNVEIGAKIFRFGNSYQVGQSYSDGDYASVYILDRAPNIAGGTLSATIHTHPTVMRFSGTTAVARWGDLRAQEAGENGRGDLVTAYNNRINSYLSAPNNNVFGWNYKAFVNLSAKSGAANLGDAVYDIRK